MESLIAPSRIDASIFHDIWQYTLVKISGNDIKVNNIVIAILLLVFGLPWCPNIVEPLVCLAIHLMSKHDQLV
jgi:hypothetical protein